jgi:hypothetical protein
MTRGDFILDVGDTLEADIQRIMGKRLLREITSFSQKQQNAAARCG